VDLIHRAASIAVLRNDVSAAGARDEAAIAINAAAAIKVFMANLSKIVKDLPPWRLHRQSFGNL
jgi:hypothetical protein